METDKTTVLIVEDEVLIAMQEQMILRTNGYEAVIATSGETAITQIQTVPEIELVLMDIDLGAGMDGTATAAEILKIRELPIVFLSSHTESDIVRKTEEVTSYGYIVKNTGEAVLLASVKMAFRLFNARMELRRHEERQRKLVENIQDVIVVIDRTATIRYKSPNIERHFGWNAEEILGTSAWENVHPDDRPEAQALFESLMERPGASGTLRCRYRNREGSYRWIAFTGTSLFHDADIAGLVGNYHDITEQQRWEQALESSMYELKKSQEVANVGNWVWHIHDNSLEWSDQMYRIFGIDREQFTGDLADVMATTIHPDDMQAVTASNKSVIEHNTPIPLEYRIIRPDGSLRTVWAEAGELEYGTTGEAKLLRGIVLDITARKEAEDKLRERTIILSKAEQLTSSGGWQWEIATDRFTFTDGWRRIHGIDRETMSREELMELAHPDDRDMIDTAFSAAISERCPYDVEHRIIRTDTGAVRTVHAVGEILFDSEGNPVHAFGAAYDITDERRREGMLRVRQDAVEASMDAIAIAGLDGVLTYVNPAFLAMWGYATIEQVISRKAIEFWEFSEQAQQVIAILETHGSWGGELHGKRADGSLFDVQLSSSIITDRQGRAICMMGIFRDITDSKRAADRINTLLAEKELMLKETHHRIKNNFATVEGLLNLQADSSTIPEVATALRDASTRVAGMRALYESLLSTDQFDSLPAQDYLDNLSARALSAYSNSGRIILRRKIDQIELDSRELFPLGTVVIELVTNSLKHAYDPAEKGVIDLTFASDGKHWALTVRDYGKGLPADYGTEQPDGYGLMLIRMLSAQLGATYTIANAVGGGTICTVTRNS